jgi:hypothetical protein
MKNISTGFGLCVLGLGIAAWPVLDRLIPVAMAGAVPVDVDPGFASSAMHNPKPVTGAFSGSRVNPCDDLAPADWFSVIHLIASCEDAFGYRREPGSQQGQDVDINNDGQKEYLNYDQFTSYDLLSSADAPMLFAVTPVVSADVTSFDFRPILRTSTLGSFAQARFPGALEVVGALTGFRDLDADGDLDLMMFFQAQISTSSVERQYAWLENTGFERSAPRIAADLNRDGVVGGADLGILLGDWGPNP